MIELNIQNNGNTLNGLLLISDLSESQKVSIGNIITRNTPKKSFLRKQKANFPLIVEEIAKFLQSENMLVHANSVLNLELEL